MDLVDFFSIISKIISAPIPSFGSGGFTISKFELCAVAATIPNAARLRSEGIITFSGHIGVQGSIVKFFPSSQITFDPVLLAISNVNAACRFDTGLPFVSIVIGPR